MLSNLTRSRALTLRSGRLTTAPAQQSYRASVPFGRFLTASAQETARPVTDRLFNVSATTDGYLVAPATETSKINEVLQTQNVQDEFWRKTRVWAETPAKDFLSYRWSVSR